MNVHVQVARIPKRQKETLEAIKKDVITALESSQGKVRYFFVVVHPNRTPIESSGRRGTRRG